MRIGLYYDTNQYGPGKVISNLKFGLEKLGIKYTINTDGDLNIILQNSNRLRQNLSNCFVGPNICTLPIHNAYVKDYNGYKQCIVPSKWVKFLYKNWIPEDKLFQWPVGIDTEKFNKSRSKKEIDFLIYHKRRSQSDLDLVVNFLNKNNQKYHVITYGNYSEYDFLNLISKSKYCFLIDSTESQGIAIQEIMSCDLPILAWDVQEWNDLGEEYKCPATSVPYWSESCGEYFYSIEQIEDKFNIFLNKTYNPRQFIVDNLSIEISTQNLIQELNK